MYDFVPVEHTHTQKKDILKNISAVCVLTKNDILTVDMIGFSLLGELALSLTRKPPLVTNHHQKYHAG